MKLNKSFKGFTLVEVLIVIIIVGILIAALLPRLQGTQARARDTARQGHINQIGSAVALYRADNVSTSVTGQVTTSSAFSGNLSSIPTDPQGTAGVQDTLTATECGTVTNANYCVATVAGQGLTAMAALENTTSGNCGVDGVLGGNGAFCVVIGQ